MNAKQIINKIKEKGLVPREKGYNYICFLKQDIGFNQAIQETNLPAIVELVREEFLGKIENNIGMLRQWLNEDRITDVDKMVDNKDLEHWVFNNLKQ